MIARAHRLVPPLAAVLLGGCAPALIQPGDSVHTAQLTPDDRRFDDGSYYRMYQFAGDRGDTITAELRSPDFDAFLLLADPSGTTLSRNDDGAGGCDARLTHVLPYSGRYRLYANTRFPGEVGRFRLTLRRGAGGAAVAGDECRGFGPITGTLRPGDSVVAALTPLDSRLDDGTFFQRWIVLADSGRLFTAVLESDAFDAYLQLYRGGAERLAADDDGAGGCNARLTHTPEDGRPLRLIVNTTPDPPGQAGRYVLRVAGRAVPPDTARDCRVDLLSPPPRRLVAVGVPAAGALTSDDWILPGPGARAQLWTLRGIAGDSLTLTLVSDAFDPYLVVLGPGLPDPVADDDSGVGCSPWIAVRLPATGEYSLMVIALRPGATGRFVLLATPPTPRPLPDFCIG